MAVGVGPQTPDGLLAKIDLVHLAPGCRINLKTSPDATLADLVAGQDVTVRGLKQVAGGSAEAGLDVHTPVSKGIPCGAGVSASVTGSFDLDISPSFTAHLSALHGLTSARFLLGGDARVRVVGATRGKAECAVTGASLLARPLRLGTFEGTIGGWPIVVTILADATLDANVHAEAGLRTSVQASAGVGGGIAYDATKRNRFSAIPVTPHATLSYDAPAVSGSAGAAIHVRPSIEAMLYGVAGPKVTVTTGADFHADPSANPWWTLDAPFDVAASLTSRVLKLSSPELSLYAHRARVAQARGAFGAGPSPGGGSTAPVPAPSAPTAWTTMAGPSPIGSAYAWTPGNESDLNRAVVDCPAAGECVAVGGGRDAEDRPALVIYTEHNGTWTHAAAPLPANADTSVYSATMARAAVNALSCPAVGTCVAVGSYTAVGTPDNPNGPTLPLILQERDGVWSATSVLPANAAMPPTGSQLAELQAVSCPAAGRCVAAGLYQDDSGTSYPNSNTGPWHGMFAMQTDSGWTVEEAPLPNGADDYGYDGGSGIQAIACPAVGECVAPGMIANPQINGGRLAGLVYTYSGGKWNVEAAPLPPGVAPGQDTIFLGMSQAGISCPAVGACVVVGEAQDGTTLSGRGFVLQQDGTSWTAQDTGHVELNAVSCPAVHACEGAGLGTQDGVAVMTQTSDDHWVSGTQPPIDVLEGSMARDITCWKAQHCLVLGRHGGGDFYTDTGYVATRSGDNWQTSEMPIPPTDTAPSSPVGAACTPGGYCAVIGWAADATSKYHQNGVLITGMPAGN